MMFFTKQTSTGTYVELGRKIVEKHFTPELVRHMAEEGISVFFEVMAKEDNSHGYVVKQDVAVVTCVSMGSGTHKDLGGPLVNYRPPKIISQFCKTYGLSHGMVITITSGGFPGGDVKSFLQAILANRDFLDFQKFIDQVQVHATAFPGKFEVLPGSIIHARVSLGLFSIHFSLIMC